MDGDRKNYPSISELEEEIEKVWTSKVKDDLINRKILYYEHTLVGSFYHHLRPFIDRYPGIRMYLDFHDPRLSYRYDLVIIRKQPNTSWEDINPWNSENCNYWFIIEFKFVGKLKDETAQKDIQKLLELKNMDENVKRAYFFSIEDKTDYFRFINQRGKWYENYYREGRGILEDNDEKNSFYIDKY